MNAKSLYSILLSYIYLLSLRHVHCFIPQIIEKIEPSIVQDKGTAYLNCTMAIEPGQRSRSSWYSIGDNNRQISLGENLKEPIRLGPNNVRKYDVKFIPGRVGYIPTMPGGDSSIVIYQLIIRNVDLNDELGYKCVIELSGQTNWPTAYGKIIIQRIAQITPNTKPQIVNEGERLLLTCDATGSPTPQVSWTKANGQPLPLPGSPQRIYNSTLDIAKASRYDRGVYRCHAQNNVGEAAEFDVMVEVNYAPTVRLARFKGAYAQAPDGNYEATLECIVNGYPDPDLYWYKGSYSPTTTNTKLQDGPRYELEKTTSYGAAGMNITDVFSVVIIRNIRHADYGEYTCRAENEMGSDKVSVNLYYQTICQGPVCPMLSVDRGGPSGGHALRPSFSVIRLVIYSLLLLFTLLILNDF